jgi:DNA-binding IclR family transcriptional regulator
MAEQQSIQSVDTALGVLRSMADMSRAMTLKEIASAAGMTASNTHRYMVSFMKAGVVVQESDTGRYDLGPAAIQMGLSAMARTDAVAVATKVIMELRAEIDLPVTIAMWTPEGPTTIRWLDASQPLTMNVKPGSRAPLLTSASGRVFLAYKDQREIQPVLAAELKLRRSRKEQRLVTMEEVRELQAEVRRHGIGRVRGERMAGVHGLSSPVFNAHGELVVSVAAIGLEHNIDSSYDGEVANAVRAAAQRASTLLGHGPPTSGGVVAAPIERYQQ